MKFLKEDLKFIKESFSYKDGVIYWAEGKARAHLPAGHQNKSGYIDIRITLPNGLSPIIQSHRIVFLIHYGFLPEIVDHKDRDPRNNRIENLRAANKRINAINTGLLSNNTSGFKGVFLSKATKKWVVQIKVMGKKIHIGTYENIEDAITARKEAENKYWSDITN